MSKIKEIPKGDFFNIDNTPTYPKIRTSLGYIDFRDEIVNNNLPEDRKVIPMSVEEVAKILTVESRQIVEEVGRIKERFNHLFS